MNARRSAAILACAWALPAAAASYVPYALGEIRLGTGFNALAEALDFRDIHSALAKQAESRKPRPDLGRRGYGCMFRDDAYADVTCVSHDEKLDGIALREIRMHFLETVLQQFSVTAEIGYFDAVMQAMTSRYGAPRLETGPDGSSAYRWSNGESTITGHAGKDLVFIGFQLASYPEAVRRKRERGKVPECR
ncbi:MAG: hypothetical protein KIT18_06855 [Burkholderiales bacterium]|nr:hypothetical protein [Burkholderiales bacterium]